MKNAHLAVIPSIAALALPVIASAAIIQPVSSQRSVNANAVVFPPGMLPFTDFDVVGTIDFGLFDESVNATAQFAEAGAAAVTITTQQSTIEPDFLHASGSVEMGLEHPAAIEASGEGISFFSVNFLVGGESPVDLHLAGSASAEPQPLSPGHAQVKILLFPQGGATIASFTALPGSPQEFDQTVTLEPGSYILSVFADLVLFHPDAPDGLPGRETATIVFDLTLAPASIPGIPGDTDDDGDIDFDDLLIVLAGWGDCENLSDCPADIDQSGDVTFADLLIVLANWT